MDKNRLRKLAGLSEASVPEDQQHGFFTNVEKETRDNTDYRRVLFTTANNQLVLMSIEPGSEIGSEVHSDNAQFIRIEAGNGKCVVGGKEYTVKDGDSVVVPVGVRHNVINTSDNKALKLYTVYSPPVHDAGTVQKTKKEAEE